MQQLLSGDKLACMQFPSHKSVEAYKPFVQAEIATGLDTGVIATGLCQKPPKVVKHFEGNDDKAPKLRLCINPMCVNCVN